MLPMTRRAGRAALALLAAGVLLLGASACSDDGDETSTSTAADTEATTAGTEATTAGTGATTPDESTPTTGAITVTGADAEWCEAMIDWSESADDVRLDDTEAFNDYLRRLQGLADDAPDAIAAPMETVAASTQAIIDDPSATLDPAADAAAQAAADEVATWVLDNCGYDLNA